MTKTESGKLSHYNKCDMNYLLLPLIIVTVGLYIIAALIWLFGCHGLDKLRHPEEYQDQGKAGERIIYNTFVKQIGVPENQILRNVYIPTKSGGTSEIDFLAISKKGIFVFECKNYAGNIYGDGKRKQWIQYLGNKKYYFYNPFMQNRNHVRHLQTYLSEFGDIPIVPMVSTISRGNWKVKNLNPKDYLLGYNSHFRDIYSGMDVSKIVEKNYNAIMAKLRPLSRPDNSIREAHIAKIEQKKLGRTN